MKLEKVLVIFCAALCAAGARAQFNHTYSGICNVPIPASGSGGASGGLSNPANKAVFSIEVPLGIVIEHVSVEINLSHTAIGDLRIEVAHCGATVGLYKNWPVSTANVNGLYTFDDSAATTFITAVNNAGPNGVVGNGSYKPDDPLSAFVGSGSAGTWTVTVSDLAASNIGGLFGLQVTFSGNHWWFGPSGIVPIADGSAGQCLSPITRVVNVTEHGTVDDVVAQISLAHPFASDLEMTVQHGSVSVTVAQAATPISNADLNGLYGFWDGAAISWSDAEVYYSGGVIPGQLYRPQQSMAAFDGLDQFGPWYITVCDRYTNDVGTLGFVGLAITRTLYDLSIAQPNGPASVTLTNSGGVPGNSFVNLFTFAQGSAPAGWIGGLDITLADAIYQVHAGPPFTGTLGACGWNVFTLPGPIPSGLPVWCASLELDAASKIVAMKRVFTYVTP